MTTQLKEKNFSIENSIENTKDTPVIKKSREERPNIDNLIKRIIVDRRKEQRKNLLVFLLIFLSISGIIVFSINS
tara:strand:+ start:61 stop:285 length:225 start_codon:yes stop_codon:yes gene_type:complete